MLATYADMSPMLTTGNRCGTANAVDATAAIATATVSSGECHPGAIYMPGTGCVFVNNHIPTSLISKTSAKILQLYHKYYQPESHADSQQSRPGLPARSLVPQHADQHQDGLQHEPEAAHCNGSFYYDNYPRINADQGGVWSATAPYGGPMANSYWHNTTAPGARLSDAITISRRTC